MKSTRLLILVLCVCILLFPHGVLAAMAVPSVEGATAASGDFILLIFYILIALIFSFMCSIAEAVLLSITPSFIAALDQKTPKRAARLKVLKQDKVDRSLAAILTLNTVAHTVGAIGAGGKATLVFGSAWFGVFSAIMTLLILFLSEIIPKTLGAVYYRQLTGVTVWFIQLLIVLLYPLIWVSEMLTKVIGHGKSPHHISREEFTALAGMGSDGGPINEKESRVIQNLLAMNTLKAKDILTPRTVMVAFPEALTVDEALEQLGARPFTRVPIYGTDTDEITGFILQSTLLLKKAEGEGDVKLKLLKRPISTITGAQPLSTLLDDFLEHRHHIAIVIDDFGGTMGLVTLEDIVETLLGHEIVDEQDYATDLQALARAKWGRRAKGMGLDPKDFKPSSCRDVKEKDT